jgi:hypothetical protein
VSELSHQIIRGSVKPDACFVDMGFSHVLSYISPPSSSRTSLPLFSYTNMQILIWLLASSGAVATNCYAPSGLEVAIWSPCPGQNTEMCCALGNGDTCTSDGLCLNPNGLKYRDGCTDPTWQDPGCTRLCMCRLTSMLLAIDN